MSRDEQVHLLVKTLDLLERSEREGTPYTEQLVRTYLAGDADDLLRFMYKDIDPQDPFDRRFVQRLLVERNRRMAERIAARLRAQPETSCFFAIGAGHLGGKDGILKLLEKAGFRLRRVGATGPASGTRDAATRAQPHQVSSRP